MAKKIIVGNLKQLIKFAKIAMQKKLSKTPAPKKDQIFGSSINKKRSAESKKKAEKIIFSDETNNKIKSLILDHNKKAGVKKIGISTAKAVVRRGMGAYSQTHRPTITGGKPNSRVAWGLARLNAFIYKVEKGKAKNPNYIQDDDLIKEL